MRAIERVNVVALAMGSRALVALLLLHLLIPAVHGADATQSREGDIVSITAQEQVIVHRNETVSAYITVHNIVDVNQEFTITVVNMPSPLSSVALPLSETLVPNHLRQLVFGIRADQGASYQTIQVQFAISTDYDTDFSASVWMNVTIAPYSNLSFGVEGISSLVVDQKVRSSVAVNISNNASFEDIVSFDLYSSSGWNWGWNMNDVTDGRSHLTLQPDSLAYVYLWVDIPAIENGAPLEGTGPRFTLTAISGLDEATVAWSFDLLMNEFRNMSIDEVETETTLAPGEDGRLSVTVRNTGNIANRVNLTLLGLDENGVPLEGMNPSDRFNSSGWTVALFGGLEEIPLQPNESRTIEIGIQAPLEFSGEYYIELIAFPNGAQERTKTTQVQASIIREKSAELTYFEEGCREILPGSSCSATLTVENTGNSYNTYSLRVADAADHLNVTVPNQVILIQNTESKTFDLVEIFADLDALAFQQGDVEIEVLDDTFGVVGTVTVYTSVAPIINWSFINVVEEIDSKGRLSIAMDVRNDGNAVDGLLVQLQSSHATPMGFIPPFIAEVEEGVEFPRSFEVSDIPLGYNFTIRAWIDLPQDQTTNGTVYVNTSIRSQFAPDKAFVHTAEGDYLGKSWQPEEQVDEALDWSGMAATAWAYTKAWSGVIFAILFAGLVIYKAVTDRQRRMDEAQILPYQEREEVGDWMEKFNSNHEEVAPVIQKEAQPIPKDAFETIFKSRAGDSTPAAEPVDPRLRDAATVVLETRSTEAALQKADDLLSSIQTEGIAQPHPSNLSLKSLDEDVSRTVRNDPHAILPSQPSEHVQTSSVPLPESTAPIIEDDLDF